MLLKLFRVDPSFHAGRSKGQIEKRNLISSVFIAMLIGVAYQEMIASVRDSIRGSGLTLSEAALFTVFLLTSLRFFIGNQLHLLNRALVEMKGYVWFFDFIIITVQSILLCFLGGASNIDICRTARIGFLEILLSLYILDVLWILTQWALGLAMRTWKRRFVPFAWGILNSLLIVSLIVARIVVGDIYSELGLIIIGLLNVVAFFADVILVDAFKVI